ncbi:CsbD family protein [Kitasatospora terrestris]|uniref:CsbD-like domain-containing protein n=1 Tax=Kitasatospora terrestris TaxID=258051 RepID=A0ABP9DAY3_9ACTN
MSTADDVENTGDKLKGTDKKNVGQAVGNQCSKAEGRARQTESDLTQAKENVRTPPGAEPRTPGPCTPGPRTPGPRCAADDSGHRRRPA